MHGLNVLSPLIHKEPHPFEVHSVFGTIQGEGPLAGMPTVFVRLSGCNLRCFFCDTDFAPKMVLTQEELIDQILKLAKEFSTRYVVLTGGEPLRQHLLLLIMELNSLDLLVQVETAGTVWDPRLSRVFPQRYDQTLSLKHNIIVCSPKTPVLNKEIQPFVHVLKYICISGRNCIKDGLPIRSTQLGQTNNNRVARPWQVAGVAFAKPDILVQPCDVEDDKQRQANVAAAVTICQRHGYRLSLQVHKILGLP